MRQLRFALKSAALLLVVLAATTGTAFAKPPPADGATAVVSVESGPYGPVLVVGGVGAGYVGVSTSTPTGYLFPAGSALYYPTIDPPAFGLGFGFPFPYQAGCTTALVSGTTQGTLSCTGSETDLNADWPAFTTDRPPIAGPGVDPFLLGSVYRADLGTYQVTYAGHPLYLFDAGPNSFFGADFFESSLVLPPWRTVWYLISPDGLAAPGKADLETEAPQSGTSYSSAVLAAAMIPGLATLGVPGIDSAAVTVYSFSGDSPWQSRCYGECATTFIPVITTGPPTVQAGVSAPGVGVIVRLDGTRQVTYDGHPLYLYSQEQPLPGGPFGFLTTGTVGNANGIHAFGGTFSWVKP
jgi:predicted lipoprotein with Yx(FWY)xxD motif